MDGRRAPKGDDRDVYGKGLVWRERGLRQGDAWRGERGKGNSDEGEEKEGCGTLTRRCEIEGGRRACQNVGTMSEIALLG